MITSLQNRSLLIYPMSSMILRYSSSEKRSTLSRSQRFTLPDEYEVENLTHLIADDMPFESEEPSHLAFALGGNVLDSLVKQVALVLEHSQWSAYK